MLHDVIFMQFKKNTTIVDINIVSEISTNRTKQMFPYIVDWNIYICTKYLRINIFDTFSNMYNSG